jgi:sulfite reductase beta subunit-like hemoprotein
MTPNTPAPETQAAELSKVEQFKMESQGLAGTIAEGLSAPATHYEESDFQLLKFHGSYQQDDRDLRVERKRAKLDKAWMFMVRCKIPGGRIAREQYLALDEIADRWANGSLRVTSRQGIQFHGVGKDNLKRLVRAINDARLTTLGACGDVNRNVMCCGAADLDGRAGLGMTDLCARLAEHFAPHSTAYWEIWCDGEKWGERIVPTREEPIYGNAYLPRKFKMAVAAPEDNCVDLYSQDIGIEVVHDKGTLRAYDLLVGGGMGFTHGNEATYPRLATRLARVRPDEALEVIETIVKIQRDHGGRADRKHARLKYLLDDRGTDWLKEELFRRLGRALPEAGPAPAYEVHDHLGWGEAPDGSLYVGIHIDNGRIADWNGLSVRTGLRELVRRYARGVRTTPKQDVVLMGLRREDRPAIEAVMGEFGLNTDTEISTLRRWAIACPALPTCGLALAESERYIPKLLAELEARGWGDAAVDIRMTGCPNSCVRTTMAEIGITGRGPGKYSLHVGGSRQGTRLGFQLQEKVDEANLVAVLQGLLEAWDRHTSRRESFGDWCARLGAAALGQIVTQG